MILAISCVSTYPLHACQWLTNVRTLVSSDVYLLQSRVCTPGVGLLVMMVWLELCISCSSSCQQHLSHSNKMQNGNLLVLVVPVLPGKNGHWNRERERERALCVVCHGCEWSYTVCADWSTVRFGFADDSHENGRLFGALVPSRLTHNNGESDGEILVI